MIKLKIEKEYLDDHQVKIKAAFEPDVFESFMRRAARTISKEHKIPGFRPGKAPYEVVKRNFGEENIERQAIELMLDDVYPKVIDEAEIQPSGPGSLDNIVSKNPPVFEFVVPLVPEVELGDYKEIRHDYKLDPVTDADIDEVMKNLRNSYATAVPVERPAQNGDLVAFKIKGILTEPEEGEDAEIVKEFSHQMPLEDQEGNNWPFTGFWNELVGLSKDDDKSVKHQYGEDTSFSRFEGKEIEFHFTIESVKEMEYPELDDDFAKTLGSYETIAELRDAIQENLESTRKEEYEQAYLSEVIEKVLEISTVKYAPNTLQEEIENVIASVEQDLANQNLDLETYLKFKNTDQNTFVEDEIKPIAVRRLERSLVLDSIAREEEIEIKEDELKAGVTQTISQLFSMPEFKKPTTSQDMRKLTDVVSFDTATRILNEKVQERLKQIARGEGEAEVEPEASESDEQDIEEETPEVLEETDTLENEAETTDLASEQDEEKASDEEEMTSDEEAKK